MENILKEVKKDLEFLKDDSVDRFAEQWQQKGSAEMVGPIGKRGTGTSLSVAWSLSPTNVRLVH